jgi:disulfide oxidoreductase YuzD
MKKQEETVEIKVLTFLQKLHRAKQSIKKLYKNNTAKAQNFSYKYIDINAILDEVEPVLLENDLLLLQPIEDGYVFSRIIDIDSGEITESCMKLPDIFDPQKIGSAITYYRRYTLQSLLSLQAVDDDASLSVEAVKTQKPLLSEERFQNFIIAYENNNASKDDLNKFQLTQSQITKLNQL